MIELKINGKQNADNVIIALTTSGYTVSVTWTQEKSYEPGYWKITAYPKDAKLVEVE